MNKLLILISLMTISLQPSFSQWIYSGNGLDSAYISCLTYDGTTLYAGTLDKGVFISNDGGINWSAAGTGLEDLAVYSICLNKGTVYAGTDDFIYFSTDQGAKWSKLNEQLSQIITFNLLVNEGNIFAATEVGLLVSTNDGAGWKPVSTELSGKDVHGITANGNFIFAGVESDGVFYSSDKGATWAQSQLDSCVILTIEAYNGKIYAGGYGGVYASSDNGANWDCLCNGIEKTIIYTLAFSENNIFSGTGKMNQGVYFSNDFGQTWSRTNSGMEEKRVFALLIINDDIIAATRNGVYRAKIADFKPTGIELQENTISEQIIWPNPANNFIMIPNENADARDIDQPGIYNELGECIMKTKWSAQPCEFGGSRLIMDVSALTQGYYFVKIKNKIFRFIKY